MAKMWIDFQNSIIDSDFKTEKSSVGDFGHPVKVLLEPFFVAFSESPEKKFRQDFFWKNHPDGTLKNGKGFKKRFKDSLIWL